MVRRLFLSLLVALTAYAASAAAQLPAPVATALRNAAIPTHAVSMHVQEIGGGPVRASHNANAPMNPASVMKLLTTYAALELLGPAHVWKTEAWLATPPDDNGIVAGDLYLRGGGDPKLSFEQFWLLLRQLRARGVREIRGDLVLDRALFDLPEHDSAAFDGQPMRPYNVGPDALLLSFKTVRLTLLPDTQKKVVQVSAEPQPANLDIVNLLKPGNNGCGDWRESLRSDLAQHGPRYRLVLTGTYPASCGQRIWNIGLLPHAQYVRGVFEQLWTELGGSIAGGVRDGGVPEGARLVASLDSPMLAEIVRDINKYSNNVMARQLYLTLGGDSGRRPIRAEDAEAAVRGWLEAKGLRFPELVIENGSGLSRRERLSADSLARLLQAAWKSPVMPELMASLPLVAVDGTMRKRLNGNGAAGNAHIKTGTLEGVRAIAGYALDRSGRRHTVVLTINHPNAAAGSQAAQDALLQWVYEGGR